MDGCIREWRFGRLVKESYVKFLRNARGNCFQIKFVHESFKLLQFRRRKERHWKECSQLNL